MRHRGIAGRHRGAGLALGLLGLVAAPASSSDWPQFNLDAQHSGVSLNEVSVHRGNVSTLHVLYGVPLPSVADGAPAFLAGVSTPLGTKDLLFLNTKDGRILALDAADGSTVWAKRPATGPRYTTSSPAVDPGRQYVYAYGLDGKVHKYQAGNGTEVVTGGWPELHDPQGRRREGLLGPLPRDHAGRHSYLYVANGGYPGDAGNYQGHVTAINLATGAQRVFNANCSNQTVHFVESGSPDCAHVQSAIWARAGVVYDARTDRIFMATGNGDYDGNVPGHYDWGDSVFALHPDGTGNGLGQPVDSYTPTEFQHLQDVDADLGSTAPAILPVLPGSKVAHLGVQSGKDAKIRLLDLDDLSGAGGPGHVSGELQKIGVPQGGQVLTAPAVWTDPVDGSVWVIIANGSGISGLQAVVDGLGNPSLTSRWTDGTGGTSPIVANGILYYAGSAGVRALDPATGGLLWSDGGIGGIHWESPIVVNGRLYVTDESARLRAYGPDPATPVGFFTVGALPDRGHPRSGRPVRWARPPGRPRPAAVRGRGPMRDPLDRRCGGRERHRHLAVRSRPPARRTGELRRTHLDDQLRPRSHPRQQRGGRADGLPPRQHLGADEHLPGHHALRPRRHRLLRVAGPSAEPLGAR